MQVREVIKTKMDEQSRGGLSTRENERHESTLLVDYLRNMTSSFTEVPFSEVDSLVLSTIAYCYLGEGLMGRVSETEQVSLPMALCGIPRDKLFGFVWLAYMGGDEFLAALLQSFRYYEVKLGFFVEEFSPEREKQFSAVTFFLPDGSMYISYRGTDTSVLGWKENFNLSFMDEVPSQHRACEYLEKIAAKMEGSLLVGGHSKGGNLAEYAVLLCNDKTYTRVLKVFNHDGPCFLRAPGPRFSSLEYAEKLRKTVPESSVIGMIFEKREYVRVVRSSGVLFAQHASTHWEIENEDFLDVKSITPEASIINAAVDKWSHLYNREERRLLVETLFSLLEETGAETWFDLFDNMGTTFTVVKDAALKLDPALRKIIIDMLTDLLPLLGEEAAAQFRSWVLSLTSGL